MRSQDYASTSNVTRSLRTQQLLLKHIAEDQCEKEHLTSELNAINNRTRIMHLIADENKKRLWKLIRKVFTEKQLMNVNLQELYDYIDKGFTIEDYQDRITPPLPGREPTTGLLHLKLRKLLEESEATSLTMKPAKGNLLSHVLHVAAPDMPSPSQPQVVIPKGRPAAIEADANLVTSKDEITSHSSSGDVVE